MPVHLFTVACSDRASTAWWSRFLTTPDRSHCFERLTDMLEPEATHAARFEWLAAVGPADEDLAARHVVLRGFPGYLERLWEQSRQGPWVVGNADHQVERLLPGLAQLWPELRIGFSYRSGIAAVASEAPSDDATFAAACSSWAERVERMRATQHRLAARGHEAREVRLEDLGDKPELVRDTWKALIGSRSSFTTDKDELVDELGSDDAATWEAWSPERREVFVERCGDLQAELGYGSASPNALQRAWNRVQPSR